MSNISLIVADLNKLLKITSDLQFLRKEINVSKSFLNLIILIKILMIQVIQIVEFRYHLIKMLRGWSRWSKIRINNHSNFNWWIKIKALLLEQLPIESLALRDIKTITLALKILRKQSLPQDKTTWKVSNNQVVNIFQMDSLKSKISNNKTYSQKD